MQLAGKIGQCNAVHKSKDSAQHSSFEFLFNSLQNMIWSRLFTKQKLLLVLQGFNG